MGSKYSLPDRIDKDTFKHVTGEIFTEQLWVDYSRDDFIPKNKLLCMERVHNVLQDDPSATNYYAWNGCITYYKMTPVPQMFMKEGEWQADERHGYGKFFDMTTGDVMSGMWVHDMLTGEGKFVGSSGPIYGQGHGKLVPSVGDVYEGGFRKNRKCGYGKMWYSKTFGKHIGEYYEGEWMDDMRHGHGVCTYANGNIYDGGWVCDIRSGEGVMTFRNGDVFVGQYVNNVMHGRGTFTPKGCDPVEAEWMNGDRVIEEIEVVSSEEEDTEEKFDFGSDN